MTCVHGHADAPVPGGDGGAKTGDLVDFRVVGDDTALLLKSVPHTGDGRCVEQAIHPGAYTLDNVGIVGDDRPCPIAHDDGTIKNLLPEGMHEHLAGSERNAKRASLDFSVGAEMATLSHLFLDAFFNAPLTKKRLEGAMLKRMGTVYLEDMPIRNGYERAHDTRDVQIRSARVFPDQ